MGASYWLGLAAFEFPPNCRERRNFEFSGIAIGPIRAKRSPRRLPPPDAQCPSLPVPLSLPIGQPPSVKKTKTSFPRHLVISLSSLPINPVCSRVSCLSPAFLSLSRSFFPGYPPAQPPVAQEPVRQCVYDTSSSLWEESFLFLQVRRRCLLL